ncbi:MAG: type IV toxin-antitoxin system AbiEi family antitoxin domain-containing protein [Gammaproteobacteria bacterium]|jgi:hypothetical protein
MTRENPSKINLLVKQAQNSVLLSSQWLNEHGITAKLAWWYVHAGWLEKVSNKLYKRSGKKVAWYDVVSVLQQQLKLPLHIGGKTALQFLGKSHYVPVQTVHQIDLYLTQKVSLPAWLNKISECPTQFNVLTHKLFTEESQEGLITWQLHDIELQLSSPERAILEFLANVPRKHTYEEAYLFMENLSRLRPEVVQILLEQCYSVLAKRLFLHLAERCQHDWLEDLNMKKITLGSGKRKVGAGGIFDSKYQISVPKITVE